MHPYTPFLPITPFPAPQSTPSSTGTHRTNQPRLVRPSIISLGMACFKQISEAGGGIKEKESKE